MTKSLRLALNYSPEAADLVAQGVIDIDLFKCPPWPEVVEAAEKVRPIYVHFDFHAGLLSSAPESKLADARRWIEKTGTPFVNTHLAPRKNLVQVLEPRAQDLRSAVRDETVAQILYLCNVLPKERVVVENVPYELRSDYSVHEFAAQPDFVNEVMDLCDCRFVLDTAHARFAAKAWNMDAWELVQAYPLQRLLELHFTGLGVDEDGRQRDSMPMQDPDWDLADKVLAKISIGDWPVPEILALEYGGVGPHFEWRSKAEVLAEQVPQLCEMLRKHGLRT